MLVKVQPLSIITRGVAFYLCVCCIVTPLCVVITDVRDRNQRLAALHKQLDEQLVRGATAHSTCTTLRLAHTHTLCRRRLTKRWSKHAKSKQQHRRHWQWRMLQLQRPSEPQRNSPPSFDPRHRCSNPITLHHRHQPPPHRCPALPPNTRHTHTHQRAVSAEARLKEAIASRNAASQAAARADREVDDARNASDKHATATRQAQAEAAKLREDLKALRSDYARAATAQEEAAQARAAHREAVQRATRAEAQLSRLEAVVEASKEDKDTHLEMLRSQIAEAATEHADVVAALGAAEANAQVMTERAHSAEATASRLHRETAGLRSHLSSLRETIKSLQAAALAGAREFSQCSEAQQMAATELQSAPQHATAAALAANKAKQTLQRGAEGAIKAAQEAEAAAEAAKTSEGTSYNSCVVGVRARGMRHTLNGLVHTTLASQSPRTRQLLALFKQPPIRPRHCRQLRSCTLPWWLLPSRAPCSKLLQQTVWWQQQQAAWQQRKGWCNWTAGWRRLARSSP